MRKIIALLLIVIGLSGCSISDQALFVKASKNAQEMKNYSMDITMNTNISGLNMDIDVTTLNDLNDDNIGKTATKGSIGTQIFGTNVEIPIEVYTEYTASNVITYTSMFGAEGFNKQEVPKNEYAENEESITPAVDIKEGLADLIESFEVLEETEIDGVMCKTYSLKFSVEYYAQMVDGMDLSNIDTSAVDTDSLDEEELNSKIEVLVYINPEIKRIVQMDLDLTDFMNLYLHDLTDIDIEELIVVMSFYDFDSTVVEFPDTI